MVNTTTYVPYAWNLTTSFHSTHQDETPLHAHFRLNATIANDTGTYDNTAHLFDRISATNATAKQHTKDLETHIGDVNNVIDNFITQLSAASHNDLPFRVV